MVKIIFILSSTLFIFGCGINRMPYDKKGLTYKNKFVFNNQIKMDGYFYTQIKDELIRVYFFEDGYYGGRSSHVSYKASCDSIDSNIRQIPYAWGCYIIENDTLKLQYIAGSGRDKYGKFMVEEEWGKIENEGSTIRFFQNKNMEGKISVIDEVYKFQPCTNKPASTNILMQEKKK